MESGQFWLLGIFQILEICQFWILGILEILEICQFWLLGILGILEILQFGCPWNLEIVVLQIFWLLGTWEYWKSFNSGVLGTRYLGSWESGNIGPPDIWGPGNLGIVVFQLLGSCREHSGQEPFLEYVPEHMTCSFWNIGHVWEFSKYGSPGQTTMPARRGSKNCVRTWSQSSESSHMSPDPAWKLKI